MDTNSNEKVSRSESIRLCAVDAKANNGISETKAGVASVSSDFQCDPEKLKQLVRKIDRCLLPFMVRTQLIQVHDSETVDRHVHR